MLSLSFVNEASCTSTTLLVVVLECLVADNWLTHHGPINVMKYGPLKAFCRMNWHDTEYSAWILRWIFGFNLPQTWYTLLGCVFGPHWPDFAPLAVNNDKNGDFHFQLLSGTLIAQSTSKLVMITSSNGNFSALLAICAGNSPVPGEFPAQRPVTRSFDVFFDLRLRKRLSKQSRDWWFETLSRPLWRHRNVCTHPSDDPTIHVISRCLYTNTPLYAQVQYKKMISIIKIEVEANVWNTHPDGIKHLNIQEIIKPWRI